MHSMQRHRRARGAGQVADGEAGLADLPRVRRLGRGGGSTMKRKPIICIDFDGVIHDYKEGWKDGSIYGNVVPGFFEWAGMAAQRFKLVVYSSRSKDPAQITNMREWLRLQWDAAGHPSWTCSSDMLSDFEFASEKPPAFLTIDDRAVRFDGRWDDPELRPDVLANYKTWTQS
jgi:hypothetical protein